MSAELALPDPDDAIHADGPWSHRTVPANGARFHLAESGDGPLVLLLHGFPTYWYSWRNVIPVLAEAGYRTIAMDLRGYGGSDKTPHGYDPLSLATDVVSVVRSLGLRDVVVVGHGWGGLLAWTLASVHPDLTRAIVPVSMPHPHRLRHSMLHDRKQRRAGRYALGYQIPLLPERRLTDRDAERVGRILRERSADHSWLDSNTEGMFRAAMLEPASAHCALEYHRWAIRSIPRRDGRTFMAATQAPVTQPVLQIHGEHDPSILLSSVDGSAEYASGRYDLQVLATGHLPHEEATKEFTTSLVSWLSTVE